MKTCDIRMQAMFALEGANPIPDDARYIAQNENGNWFAYTAKPEITYHSNAEPVSWSAQLNAPIFAHNELKRCFLLRAAPTSNWEQELYEITSNRLEDKGNYYE